MKADVGQSEHVTEAVDPTSMPSVDGARVLAQAAELVAGFEADSVTALLHAACSSPTARQAMSSCAGLLMSVWASPPAGSRIAVAGDLAPLVVALRETCPDLVQVEDFLPLDPRWRVNFRATSGGEFWDFRVHPGGLEAPLLALQDVVNHAEALDPVLVPRFGDGVGDMLQVASRVLDAELEVMAPVWGDLEVSLDSPPVVSEAEVAAARRYLAGWRPGGVLSEVLAELLDDGGGRLSGAARGLMIDCRQLSFDAGPGRAHVGPALLVRGPAGVLPVPAALVIESLWAAVTIVLRFVAGHAEVQGEDVGSGGPQGDATGVGCVWCGICERRMQSHWANAAPYYRCRFPAEYALANHVEHPLNVNLREDAIIGQVDDWLTLEFAPHRLAETIRDLAAAQQPDMTRGVSGDDKVARKITNCDARLAQYRAALDAGANSVTVAGWIAGTEAERATYELAMRRYEPRPPRHE